jgi:hypothetical protein
LYPDGTVQHAGILFGPNGRSEHEGVNQPADAAGPQGRWVCRRRVGAVTGAFLACRAEAFHNSGGFDAYELPIWFGDVDFCLRLRAKGLHILFDPAICAVHHESRTVRSLLSGQNSEQYWRCALEVMHKRWGQAMLEDPGFNPHFSRWDPPFSSMVEPSLDAIIAILAAARELIRGGFSARKRAERTERHHARLGPIFVERAHMRAPAPDPIGVAPVSPHNQINSKRHGFARLLTGAALAISSVTSFYGRSDAWAHLSRYWRKGLGM